MGEKNETPNHRGNNSGFDDGSVRHSQFCRDNPDVGPDVAWIRSGSRGNDLGCFKEEGLEVNYKFEDDRSNVLAAFARGNIEVNMRTVVEHQGRPRDELTPGVIIGTIDESVGGGDHRTNQDLGQRARTHPG